MYQIQYTGQFRKDLKLIKKRSDNEFELLREMVKTLEFGGHSLIPSKHKPHILSGHYSKHWECHVLSDLLLIWRQNDSEKSIILVRAGTHSDLF
jgi:mRNA interferase YafQ